ncbi:MAG: carboxypeptidase regulatory-like domain-containing protein, partial [Acidobacteriaceae bacterium]|nr:carboxypeptidase regulatory-like domain-containing protein [Acidobacteriaceae bacterium]
MFRLRTVFVVVSLLAFSSLLATAQSDRGTITGTVTDPSGAVVKDAKVTATNKVSGEVRETRTTSDGNYTLAELIAAPYTVTVEAGGFKGSTQDVVVPVQVTRRADFQLVVGAATETTTVTAEAPVIQTESAVQQTTVTERQVRELPLQVSAEFGGRTPLSFIFLDSNVVSATGAGNFENGGRGTDAS